MSLCAQRRASGAQAGASAVKLTCLPTQGGSKLVCSVQPSCLALMAAAQARPCSSLGPAGQPVLWARCPHAPPVARIANPGACRFLAEKVVHHPTVIAAVAEGRRWRYEGDADVKSKFWGRSIELRPEGEGRLA